MEDDDIPPLEDMSELLKQAKLIKNLNEASPSSSSPVKTTSLHQSTDTSRHDNTSSSSSKEKAGSAGTRKGVPSKETTKSAQSSSGFAGMKKGFLFSGSSKTKTSSEKSPSSSAKLKQPAAQKQQDVDEIPLIRPKEGSGDSKERYCMEEVQDALRATAPLLQNKEWINDDLLAKLEKHPRIAKQLTDPRYAQAVQKFQTNPRQAMLEYKDNKDVQQFFKDFCGLLGNHFSFMGEGLSQPTSTPPSHSIRTQDASSTADLSVRSSTNPKQATAADEAKMQQILSNPEIREILMDQRMQRLMEALRSNPDQGQRILQSADPGMRSKIQKLVEAGLLGFAS